MVYIEFNSFGEVLNAYHKGKVKLPKFVFIPCKANISSSNFYIKEKAMEAANAIKAI